MHVEMKKYRFKLESLLKYRQLSEDKLRQELAIKMQNLRRCEKKLSFMRSEKKRYAVEFNQVQSSGVRGNRIFVYRNYLSGMTKQIEQQEIKRMESKKEVDEAQKDYLEARKKLKSVEKLKEKDFQRYLDEMKIFERKALDEIATTQYIANRVSTSRLTIED